jgi:outer membrane biosynthesis protein TonB
MNSYIGINIASAEEEEQTIAKFLKILNSLGEHASSYLFQKGVVLGDESFTDYDRQLSDNKFRDSIINMLIRPSGEEADKDALCLVAVLLFHMSKEATQFFLTFQAHPEKTGASSSVIALSHLMALIDRATAFLKLPSVNDKAYWRLMTMQPSAAAAPPQPPPAARAVEPAPPPAKAAAPKKPQPPPQPSPPPIRPPTEKPIVSPPTLQVPSPIPASSAKAKPTPAAPASQNNASKRSKQTGAAKNNPKPVTPVEPVNDANKPEGPLKAMVRRISEEIHDNSYEAIIEALKDDTLMKDLYNSPNNPISVKITEVNTKERVVYLIKQKRGAPEPVTFRLIRKLVTEIQ